MARATTTTILTTRTTTTMARASTGMAAGRC